MLVRDEVLLAQAHPLLPKSDPPPLPLSRTSFSAEPCVINRRGGGETDRRRTTWRRMKGHQGAKVMRRP